MSPAPDERDRIRAAMDRILTSTPERSNGALTIVALAIEADVPSAVTAKVHRPGSVPPLTEQTFRNTRARELSQEGSASHAGG
ncbi:hypothetical protein [Streptomyces sp. NPDC058086]|uniref:hypothetical protein n=1 Tax=Streptomyces sp. NPDC058086 TaxID=3346334 RepID=UPI0036E31868